MTEQSEHLQKALRECAEHGVPEVADSWPAIRERVSGEAMRTRMSEEQVDEERAAGSLQRSWLSRLVPNTPLGWVLAILSVLILSTGAYAASGPVGDLLRYGLPGPAGPGQEEHTGPEKPKGNLSGLRTEISQTQTEDGVRVTLDWAYADERFVAVGLHTQDLRDGAQKPEGSNSGSGVLEPSLWDDTGSNEAKLPPYMKITDASGQDFDTVGGGTLLGPDRTGAEAVFDAPEGIQPGRAHRFRLEVPLQAGPAASGKPEAGPFVFVFEIPVLAAPTVELDEKAEAKGITLTLKRVVDSPLLPQAVVCFEPPDDEHSWMPFLRYDEGYEEGVGSSPQDLGDGCWSLMMTTPVEGHSSVTVMYLEGQPKGPLDLSDEESLRPKRIRGPWTFEFEAPDP